jgi:pyridoxal phosphate enzyme (YggS family)
MSDIQTRLDSVNQRIAEAAHRAERDPAGITLIAVSKTWPWDYVAEAIACGQKHFGENKVQEALTKTAMTRDQDDIVWHFIGHLQSNKAKSIPGNFQWLHTLDSLKLARLLDKACGQLSSDLNVLVQVNIADDPAKQGLSRSELSPFIDEFLQAKFQHLKLRGLMTIGAVDVDEKTRRQWFAELRNLQQALSEKYALPRFDQLSMGMSGDFEEAIEEGATFVRVGSTIFGERK